jgi:hypothetical protein
MFMVIAAAITCQTFFFLFHTAQGAIDQQSLSWKNVRIGGSFAVHYRAKYVTQILINLYQGGGGFVPSIVFNPSMEQLLKLLCIPQKPESWGYRQLPGSSIPPTSVQR